MSGSSCMLPLASASTLISGSGIIPLASLLDLILFCKLQTSGPQADLSVLLRRGLALIYKHMAHNIYNIYCTVFQVVAIKHNVINRLKARI